MAKQAKISKDERQVLIDEFFENNPNANSVLVVGTNLFLNTFIGAARAHAEFSKEEMEEVFRNQQKQEENSTATLDK